MNDYVDRGEVVFALLEGAGHSITMNELRTIIKIIFSVPAAPVVTRDKVTPTKQVLPENSLRIEPMRTNKFGHGWIKKPNKFRPCYVHINDAEVVFLDDQKNYYFFEGLEDKK